MQIQRTLAEFEVADHELYRAATSRLTVEEFNMMKFRIEKMRTAINDFERHLVLEKKQKARLVHLSLSLRRSLAGTVIERKERETRASGSQAEEDDIRTMLNLVMEEHGHVSDHVMSIIGSLEKGPGFDELKAVLSSRLEFEGKGDKEN